ncbi:MAG: autotransporter-associated beta strand repeat-containing protein [Opitutae bacterium]
MANPRRSNYLNRQNAVWLMNAASMVVAMGAVVSPYKAKATAYTWTGGGTDTNVTTPSNWGTGITYSDGSSSSGATQNTQLFDSTGTTRSTVSIGSNKFFGAVTFGAMSGTTGYTFTNLGAATNILSISGVTGTSTPSLTNNFTNGSITFNVNIQNANQNNTWTGATGSTTIFNNSVYVYSSGLSRSLTLTGTGANFTFNSGVLNTSGTTAVQTTAATTLFIKNTGTTILQGNNTFRGALNIAAGTGTVQLNGDNTMIGDALTSSTKYVITNGKVLLGNSLALGISTNTITLGSAATVSGDATSLLTNGAVTIANPITLYTSSNTATATLGGNQDVNSTYSGLITIGKTTGATITQVATTNGNAVSFTGGIKASVGNAAAPATLVLTGPGDIKFNTGALTDGTGVLAITVGATTLSTPNVTFTGSESAPYTYTGPTKLIGGSLTLSNPYSISAASTLNSGGSQASDVGTLNLTGGLANSNAYHMNALNFGGRLYFNSVGGSSTLTFDALTGSAQTGSSEKRLVINSGVTLVVAGTFDLIGSTATTNRNLRIEGDGNITFNGEIRNNASGTAINYIGGLNKYSGNGVVTLNGANTFNNGVIFGAGYINVGSAENPGVSGPLGSSGTLTMSGGYLQYSASNQYDYSSRFSTDVAQKYRVDTNSQTVTWASSLASVGGSLTKTGLGTLILSGANSYDSGTTLAGGSLQLDNASAIGSTGTISFTGGALKFTSTNTTDYSGRFSTAASQQYNLDTNGQSVSLGTALTSSGGTLTKNGNGVLTLTAAATYSGDTTVNQGELAVSSANTLSTASSVVVQSGATLNLNSTDQSVKGIAGAGTVSLGTANLTINDGDSRTFSGDVTGGGNVIKSGSGVQTISSALSYTGTTAINGGTLRVNNTLATSGISVAGSATLTGKGTISAPIQVSANGIITAGDTTLADASRGALTVSTLTFSGAAVINLANINLGAASSILNTGALSALGGAGSITVNITNGTQLADNSSFTILKYTSLDNFNAFIKGTITGASARQSTTLVNDIANSQIILTTAGDTLNWSGAQSSTWTTTSGNLNWSLNSSGDPTDYLAGDVVAFTDSATNFTVSIAEAVSPSSLTFNNSTNNYTINSAASTSFGIEGTTSLIKNGSGRVDINAPLKITGGLTVNNGTIALNNGSNSFTGNINLNGAANLELGATGALGTTNTLTFGLGATGKLSLKGNNATLSGLANNTGNPGTPIIENGSSSTNSTLTLNLASGTNTFDGVMQNGSSNTLSLTKTGAGTLVLTNDNTFTGLTTVTAGTLQLGNGGSTGIVAGDISIGASGTLNLNRTGKLSTSQVFSGSGALNLKYGELELLGNNTFTGTATIYSGTTLTIGSTGTLSSSATIVDNGTFDYAKSGSNNLGAVSGTGDLKISAGAVSQTGTNSLSGSLTIASGATYALTSTGSFTSISAITDNGILSIGAHADYTIAAPITGTGTLVSTIGAGKILYLTKDNSYQGTTTITSGTLNVGNGSSTGSLGTGAVTIASGAELILARSTDTTLSNTITGAGKLTMGTSGKVFVVADNQIDITGELKFGATNASSTHSTLDLTGGSINVGSLRVVTDATTNSGVNYITIGSTKSLNIKGLVTIGLDNGSNPTTNLTVNGDGTLNIGTLASPTNANVNVGASATASKINYVNWDMSALANLNMYLGTGTLSVGADNNSTGGVGGTGTGVTVKLANTTTIVAPTLLMDGLETKTFTLSLGSGVNTLNVDTVTVGGLSTRATNIINFNSGTGSLFLRNKAGTGRVTLNVQNATNSSGNNEISSFDVSGHTADLLLSTVTVGQRLNLVGTGAGYGSGYLAFDTGTFDVTTLNIANKSHNGTAFGTLNGKTVSSTVTGNIVGLVSLGGGTVTIGSVDLARHGASNVGGVSQGLIEFFGSNVSTVGAITMATAASPAVSGTADVTGNINVADGTVFIASISGASAAANSTATANLNISGGTLTMGGNITRVGGVGTAVFNLNFSGGILDMNNHSIGATGSDVIFNWTKGTLKNVSGLNGADGITVNTGDQYNPVYLDGTNTFTSKITIKDSILQLNSNTALAANSKIGFDGTLGVLKLDSGVTLDVSGNLASGNAQLDTNGNNITFSNSVSGLTSFTKIGSGKLTLSSTSGSLAPTVSILGGTIEIGNGNNQVPAGGFLNGTTSLTLDALGGSPEIIANGVKVDLDANVNLLNSGATLSGSKGTSAYSFNFKKDIISQDGSTATISATDMITGSGSKFNVGAGATLTISGSFIDGTTATQITKNGTGILEFTGTGNTYSGATTVNAGTLNFYQDALAGSSTAITVNNGASLTAVNLGANVSLNVASGANADLSGTALEVEGLSGAGTVVLSGGASTLTVGSGAFSGNLSSSGATALIKKGSGTLTLSGVNSLSGPVTLNGGIVSVSDFNALGTATDSPENLTFQGGKLQYTGAGESMTRDLTVGNGGAGFASSGSGALVIGQDVQMDFADTSASNRTLSLGGTSDIAIENIYNPNKIDAADVTNVFTKLVKQDTNKWIVLGAGAGFVEDAQTEIDIQNGELGFAMGALGSKPTITVGGVEGATATLGWQNGNTEDVSGRVNLRAASSAAFDIPSGNTVTFASALNGGNSSSASVTKTGDGILNLNAANSFSGGFTISGGTVKAGITGAVGTGAVTVNANTTLIVNAVLANTITIKSNGTLTSDQANQDIDDTTVEEGGVIVPGGNTIGTLTAHNLTLKGGSIVNWQISNALGAVNNIYTLAGSGYDTFVLNSLALTDAALSKRVHIQVKNIFGEKASNFDKGSLQTFKFAKLTNKLSLTDAAHVTDLFEIDASQFEYVNGLQTDHLVWYMTVSADREYLYVVSVPEPSTYGLGLGALALALAAVRRRKQKKNLPVA